MTLVARRASMHVCLSLVLLAASPHQATAQQSAARVHDLVQGLTVTSRRTRGESTPNHTGVLPFPLTFSKPYAERVGAEDAAVTSVAQRGSVLAWPNAIVARDWEGWVDARATTVPTTADPRYASVVEMHDAGSPEKRNSILVASVGKGKLVYASLTLPQQIANGVPGAMRLFINLLSAGLAN